MSSKPNNFAGNPNSQYDATTIAKETHDFWGQNIRVADSRSIADKYYTHLRASYNGDNFPTEVIYYRGLTQHLTQVGCVADVSNSLVGKYFSIYSAPDQKQYFVWYRVSGVGAAPIVPNAIEVMVDIQTNDSAAIVALATQLTLSAALADKFVAIQNQSVVSIQAFSSGETTNSTANTSGFTIQNTAGTQVVTNTITIEYSGSGHPIYQGQELKNMDFNVYTGKFERNNDVTVDNMEVNVGLNYIDDSVEVVQFTHDKLNANANLQVNNVDVSVLNAVPTSTVNGNLEATQLNVLSEVEAIADSSASIDSKITNDYGTSVDAIRTAAQIGNAVGAADFGVGAAGAQTLRTAASVFGTDPNGTVTQNRESGKVDSNSTVTPLLAGGIFTGAWVDASQYSCVSWTINSDVDSAVNGLRLQFSHDGSTIIRQSATNFTGAANGVFFSFPVHAKYFRMFYENGAVNQSRFYLDVQLHEEYNGLAAVPLDTPLNDKSSATAVKSVIAGKSVDGVYVNQRASGVSTLNSTSALLGTSGTFTGTWEDVVGFSTIAISVYAAEMSANDGLILEYSSDGINVDDSDLYTIATATGNQFTVGVLSKYFRVRYVNGTIPQTSFRLSTIYHINNIKPSSHRINDSISGQNDAELSKAVLTGRNPDGTFVNVTAQGTEATNSTSTLLGANEVFRGPWKRWSDEYLNLISIIKSDVAGTLYVDASEEASPTNGSDVDVAFSGVSAYNPAVVPVLRRNTPLQSVWVRHRYVNGSAAQSAFNLSAIFTTSDPGDVYKNANDLPTLATLTSINRSIQTISNATATGYQDIPVDVLTGDPRTTVQTIRDDILLKPMNSVQVEQGVISTVPARIDPSPLLNRRKVIISNDGTSNCSIGFSSSITYNSASFVLKGGKERELELDASVPLWAVAEDTGGVTSVLTRTGTTTGGTATGTANTLTSNNTYANITAAAQTATVTGYTAGTANPLVSVKLGVEGAKQSGQFETVQFVDVVTGSTGNTGTISSASVTSNVLHKYLISISWANPTSNITSVTGMGATWTLVGSEQTSTLDCGTAVYINTTPPVGNDTITVNFSATTGGAVMAVSRYSGVNLTSPVQVFETLNAVAATNTYSDSLLGTDKGMLVTSVGIKAQTHTPGSGATERIELHQAATAGIAVSTLALTSTGAQAYSGTLGGNVKYGIVTLTLSPANAVDPRISLSYELSAVPGATSGLVTFTSTTDSSTLVDITGDRAWVVADIPNIKAIATGNLISAAAANVDQLYLQLTDTTGNTTRISVLQTGRSF